MQTHTYNDITHGGPTRNKFSVTLGRCRQKELMKSKQDSFKCQAAIFISHSIRNLDS